MKDLQEGVLREFSERAARASDYDIESGLAFGTLREARELSAEPHCWPALERHARAALAQARALSADRGPGGRSASSCQKRAEAARQNTRKHRAARLATINALCSLRS